jgi:23S rRNA pseudouridine1911/1915/1917 synthase
MLKTKIEIIYQDDDILVINKPSGISITKDRTSAPELTDILSRQLEPQVCSELRLVHRLDKDTSGVMILARNKETQSQFSSYFEKKLIKKTYLAIVTGAISAQKGTITVPLAHSRKNPALMCIAAKKGKEAVTDWKLLADFGTAALLAVYPLTGRTHQIRVHLPSIGLPLAIDPLYGSSHALFLSDFKLDYRLAKGQAEKPLIKRLTLHAYQIKLTEMQPNRPDCFVAGLDKKFVACLKMLTKHNRSGLDAFLKPDDFFKIVNAQRFY